MKFNYIGKNSRIIAVLLAFIFIVYSVPISINALEFEKTTIDSVDSPSITNEPECSVIPKDELEEGAILGEVVSRREETVKHFDLGHGVFRAVTYGSAVHRKDANGEWQDIDNRLLPTDQTAKKYSTSDGRTTVSADLESSKSLISICENGYTISMTPVIDSPSLNKSKIMSPVQITNHSKNTEYSAVSMTVKEAAEISNTTYAKYSDVFVSTDIEYVLTSNDIKENIIVKNRRDGYKYSFSLSVDNLIPKLIDSGEIILYDSSTGKDEYRIPAPYMYDSAGEISYNVYYELKESNESYLINVISDPEWINSADRAFPVTIDPTIKKSMTWDTYITSTAPSTNYGSSDKLWISSNCISFLRSTMPTLPSGCQLYSAKLYVYYYYNSNVTDGRLVAGAYKVNHSWTESGSSGLTWNIANPGTSTYISSTRLSSGVMSGTRGAYVNSPKTSSFNVTSAVASWYTSPSTNYGIALKYESGTNGSVILKSYESGTDYRAYYVITYTEPNIVSGVYKIKNANNGLYLDVYNGNRSDGTAVIQYPGESTDYRLNQLFKITYIGRYGTDEQLNYYSIRTMLDSHKGLETGFSASTRKATIDTMACSDTWADLLYGNLWAISKNGNYYTLKNGSITENSYLTSPSNSTSGEQVFSSETVTDYSNWILEPYTGTALNSVAFTNYTDTLVVGESFQYEAYMYSSQIGVNGPVQYSITNIDGTATDKATINGLGRVTALKPGQFKIKVTYSGAPWIWTWTITIAPKYSFKVVHYYDQGYNIRYNNVSENILSYQNVCSAVFLELFSLGVETDIISYRSCADNCKGTVTIGNLTNSCMHSSTHLTTNALRDDIISKYGNGDNVLSRVVWSGHLLNNNPSSDSSSYSHTIVMTIRHTTDENHNNKSDEIVRYQSIFTLLHETSHQLGAPDHYCYGDDSNGPTNPCSNPSGDCWKCHKGLNAPPDCVMTYRNYKIEEKLQNGALDDLYCSQCTGTGSKSIPYHLSNHH